MRVERPPTEAAEAVADLWVDLADEQLEHGSHLAPSANRERVREAAVRHIVTDTLLVARGELPEDGHEDGPGAEGDDSEGDDDPGGDTGGDGSTPRTAEGDAILGFVMFSVESGSFEQDETRGIVENLYVVPGARGTGVGAELLAAAEAALAERGCEVAALDVLAGNERARRFYERHGYGEHRLELEKPLGEGG